MLVLFFIIFFTVVAVIYAIRFINRKRAIVALVKDIHGPTGLAYLSIVYNLIKTPRHKRLELSTQYYNKYGTLYKLWLGPLLVIRVSDPELAKVIFKSSKNIEKGMAYRFMEPWLGTGLLTSGGSKWFHRRKILTPAFHFAILEPFFDVMVEQCSINCERLEKEMGSEKFDIFPYISNCTLDIICETAMGIKLNAQNGPSDYIRAVQKMNEIISLRIFRPWIWPEVTYRLTNIFKQQKNALKILHGLSQFIIQKRRQERKEMKTKKIEDDLESMGLKKKRKAFLDLLLEISEEMDEQLSDDDIREEVDTFMFEGHDTTAAVLMWSVFLIGSHPEVQEKINSELYSVFGDSDRPPSMREIAQLEYLDRVIKETLRLFPAVPTISREVTEDVDIGDFHIPVGVMVEISLYRLHRHPIQFPNPEKFNPDNFLPENVTKRHLFSFVPFSAGPRNCIGQKYAMLEMKVFLSSMLRKYKVESMQKFEDLMITVDSIMHSENGIHIQIKKREYHN